MKHLILKTKYVVLALLVSFSFSCSPEDGAQGPAGPAGADGTNGINGNANVQVITKDISSASGTFEDVIANELTQDILDNDVVLGYIKRSGNNAWHPLPSVGDNLPFSIAVYLSQGFYSLDFVDRVTGGSYSITSGYLDVLKIVIIESTSSSRVAGSSTKANGLEELINAGVNIKDYYAVCDYYGIVY